MRIKCDCGATLNVKDEFAGRKVRCPKCKQGVEVPSTTSEPTESAEEIGQTTKIATEPEDLLMRDDRLTLGTALRNIRRQGLKGRWEAIEGGYKVLVVIMAIIAIDGLVIRQLSKEINHQEWARFRSHGGGFIPKGAKYSGETGILAKKAAPSLVIARRVVVLSFGVVQVVLALWLLGVSPVRGRSLVVVAQDLPESMIQRYQKMRVWWLVGLFLMNCFPFSAISATHNPAAPNATAIGWFSGLVAIPITFIGLDFCARRVPWKIVTAAEYAEASAEDSNSDPSGSQDKESNE